MFVKQIPSIAVCVLMAGAPAALAQLAPGPGTGVPPHEDFLLPCSACHVRFDPSAQAEFDIKKPVITSSADFIALRDLQHEVGSALSVSHGQLIDIQIHPVPGVECTLCHEKFEEKHAAIDMVIDEDDPAASCVGSGCHKDLSILTKIPYWTMAFVNLPPQSPGAESAVGGLLDRALDANALVQDLAAEEGTWKQEVKSSAPITAPQLGGIATLLEDHMLTLTANLPDLAGSSEGKVGVKTGVSNESLRFYVWQFDRALADIASLRKDAKMESKWEPGLPIDAMDLFMTLVEFAFDDLVLKELKEDKVVWTLLSGGEIVGEFKSGETKIAFNKLVSGNYAPAVFVLIRLEGAYPEGAFKESKYELTYEGTGDNRLLITDTIKALRTLVPDKELKFELKAKKDTQTIPETVDLLSVKVQQLEPQMTKLKTEYKFKVGKIEPEVKAEATAAAP